MAEKAAITGKAPAKKAGAGTRVESCSCENAYQDQKFGKGKRVKNLTQKDNKYRCTVCGTLS